MKTEAELRAYREDLRIVAGRKPKCPCPFCIAADSLFNDKIKDRIAMLDWMLGDSCDMEFQVETAAKVARS